MWPFLSAYFELTIILLLHVRSQEYKKHVIENWKKYSNVVYLLSDVIFFSAHNLNSQILLRSSILNRKCLLKNRRLL